LPKAYSILLFGTGIFVSWLYILVYAIIGIIDNTEGFATIYEIDSLLKDFTAENVKENNETITTLLLYGLGAYGVIVGILILLLGGIFLLYEKIRRINSYEIKIKPVSLFWQVVCSTLPGFDLWALYRIKKLRIGSIVYAIQYVSVLFTIYSGMSQIDLPSIISIGLGVIFSVVVYLWSRNWNNELKSSLKIC